MSASPDHLLAGNLTPHLGESSGPLPSEPLTDSSLGPGTEHEITPGTLEYTAGLVQWAWGSAPPQNKAERQLWYSCRAIHLQRVPEAAQAGVKAALRPLNHPQMIDQTAKLAGAVCALLGMYLFPLVSHAADTALFSTLPVGMFAGFGVWWAVREVLWGNWTRSLLQLQITPLQRPPAFNFKRRDKRRGRT